MNDPANFCKFLTNGLVYNNNGEYFTASPCCYFSKNYKINPSDDVSLQLKNYKKQWLTEDFNTTCRICLNAENSGLYSYRQSSFDQILGNHGQPEFLTVAVNKKCNLACASCDAKSSSFWYQENNRHGVAHNDIVISMHREDKQGQITTKFLSAFDELDLSKITYVKFGGGEPLMTDTHEQILELLPNRKNITVQYTSNFSLMPNARVLKLWETFGLVKWVASIDGVNDQFEFLRWPYRWNNLQQFVLEAKSKVPKNVMFGVEHTINVLNALYFENFKTWFDQNFQTNLYGDKSDLNLHSCNGVMSLSNMPPKLRQLIKVQFGSEHAISVMIDQHPYIDQSQELVTYLDQLDSWRNTQWRGIFPDVQEFLND